MLVDGVHLLSEFGPDHWSQRVLPPDDPAFVAVLAVTDVSRDTHHALVLMKDSAPGYQTVVTLTDRQDPNRCLNRVPTHREYELGSTPHSRVHMCLQIRSRATSCHAGGCSFPQSWMFPTDGASREQLTCIGGS